MKHEIRRFALPLVLLVICCPAAASAATAAEVPEPALNLLLGVALTVVALRARRLRKRT